MKFPGIISLILICLSWPIGFIVHPSSNTAVSDDAGVTLIVLGTIQDAGSPHIGCEKSCCLPLFSTPPSDRRVVALGLIDRTTGKRYLIEATPDFTFQIDELRKNKDGTSEELIDGIFITHAHIGHYTSLMYLGKEAMGAHQIPVYTMPRMTTFLTSNGPWSQLVLDQNIKLKTLQNGKPISLSQNLHITPILVPHRDEFSETVGFRIEGQNKTALFIPDIDKWEKWDRMIENEIRKVDVAFIDATFYNAAEVGHRDIAEIPHPLMIESMQRLKDLKPEEKDKIRFIHFNHTNPVLNAQSKEAIQVEEAGFQLAQLHEEFNL